MLVFHTPTLIPIEGFTTFGLNAKPNVKTPIGFFGTGLKYAVAITLRLGGTFYLYIGSGLYEFYISKGEFRGAWGSDLGKRPGVGPTSSDEEP